MIVLWRWLFGLLIWVNVGIKLASPKPLPQKNQNASAGYENEAAVFREIEIEGSSEKEKTNSNKIQNLVHQVGRFFSKEPNHQASEDPFNAVNTNDANNNWGVSRLFKKNLHDEAQELSKKINTVFYPENSPENDKEDFGEDMNKMFDADISKEDPTYGQDLQNIFDEIPATTNSEINGDGSENNPGYAGGEDYADYLKKLMEEDELSTQVQDELQPPPKDSFLPKIQNAVQRVPSVVKGWFPGKKTSQNNPNDQGIPDYGDSLQNLFTENHDGAGNAGNLQENNKDLFEDPFTSIPSDAGLYSDGSKNNLGNAEEEDYGDDLKKLLEEDETSSPVENNPQRPPKQNLLPKIQNAVQQVPGALKGWFPGFGKKNNANSSNNQELSLQGDSKDSFNPILAPIPNDAEGNGSAASETGENDPDLHNFWDLFNLVPDETPKSSTENPSSATTPFNPQDIFLPASPAPGKELEEPLKSKNLPTVSPNRQPSTKSPTPPKSLPPLDVDGIFQPEKTVPAAPTPTTTGRGTNAPSSPASRTPQRQNSSNPSGRTTPKISPSPSSTSPTIADSVNPEDLFEALDSTPATPKQGTRVSPIPKSQPPKTPENQTSSNANGQPSARPSSFPIKTPITFDPLNLLPSRSNPASPTTSAAVPTTTSSPKPRTPTQSVTPKPSRTSDYFTDPDDLFASVKENLTNLAGGSTAPQSGKSSPGRLPPPEASPSRTPTQQSAPATPKPISQIPKPPPLPSRRRPPQPPQLPQRQDPSKKPYSDEDDASTPIEDVNPNLEKLMRRPEASPFPDSLNRFLRPSPSIKPEVEKPKPTNSPSQRLAQNDSNRKPPGIQDVDDVDDETYNVPITRIGQPTAPEKKGFWARTFGIKWTPLGEIISPGMLDPTQKLANNSGVGLQAVAAGAVPGAAIPLAAGRVGSNAMQQISDIPQNMYDSSSDSGQWLRYVAGAFRIGLG